MSIRALNLTKGRQGVTGSEKALLLGIADAADEHGDAFPGLKTLSDWAEVGARQIKNLVQALETKGKLLVYDGEGIMTAHGPTNRYRLILPGARLRSPQGKLPRVIPATIDLTGLSDKQDYEFDGETWQGVKWIAPRRVNWDSPQGVNPVAPKPKDKPKDKPSRARNPIYDRVAHHSFGYPLDATQYINEDGKTENVLIGKITAWVTQAYGVKVNEQVMIDFYADYAQRTRNSHPPHDLNKFKAWFDPFMARRRIEAVPTTPPPDDPTPLTDQDRAAMIERLQKRRNGK